MNRIESRALSAKFKRLSRTTRRKYGPEPSCQEHPRKAEGLYPSIFQHRQSPDSMLMARQSCLHISKSGTLSPTDIHVLRRSTARNTPTHIPTDQCYLPVVVSVNHWKDPKVLRHFLNGSSRWSEGRVVFEYLWISISVSSKLCYCTSI